MENLHTFDEWRALGYLVLKGQKGTKRVEDNRCYFRLEQVISARKYLDYLKERKQRYAELKRIIEDDNTQSSEASRIEDEILSQHPRYGQRSAGVSKNQAKDFLACIGQQVLSKYHDESYSVNKIQDMMFDDEYEY